MSVRVAIVEDDAGYLEILVTELEDAPGIQCVGQFHSGQEAVRRLAKCAPDVVLMDIKLPDVSGIECVRKLKKQLPSVQFVMLTSYEEQDLIFNALKAGACGYLLKRSSMAKVREAIDEVSRGGAPMTGLIARKVVQSFAQAAQSEEGVEKLSDREREILQALASGRDTKEIASALSVSVETVRSHLRHIYEKLHVNSRTQAVLKYLGKSR